MNAIPTPTTAERSAPRPGPGGEPWSPEHLGRSGLARLMAHDYAASVLVQAALTALPLLVVALLGQSAGAYFFLPLTVITAVDALVAGLLEQRAKSRADKDFAAADAIRDQIKAAGIEIEDTPDGPKWSLS